MPNRLSQETSPYLRQHADNPVDWHPWGPEALELAREQDKPILLSIGYSACHWCHVMAHESFEDPDVARVMNEHFVNIKVDREERPDLDQIYQAAHAMLARRSGGWPLTMFLTPDQKPFFGGTYFPKEPRYGLPGFKDLLGRVAVFFRQSKGEIEEQNSALLQALDGTVPRATPNREADGGDFAAAALAQFKGMFDMVHGGLGSAPKFPHPAELEFLLRHYGATGDANALHMAVLTMTRMAEGGIYDQLGGGFCRYSVDETWTIPDFEKMLYDNGPLLRLSADAWSITGTVLFRRVVEETAAWVGREMQGPEGGYYSTLDADSEHEEGKFYVWTPEEAQAVLDADEYAVSAAHYGLDGGPNFEGRHWHLRVAKPLERLAGELSLPETRAKDLLESARRKLFAERERRVRPGRDDKVLASWNGLMIKGMAHAGRVLGHPEWVDSARRAARFVREHLYRDGRLLAVWKDGRTRLNAYLDDHAFLLDGLLELLQADFRAEELDFARRLADDLLARFEDPREGGFFFTSHDHEPLIHRPKPGPDNATPSGNGTAAFALGRLGHLLGETRYLDSRERTLRLFAPSLRSHPSACATLLAALEESRSPPTVAVLRGSEASLAQWEAELRSQYAPHVLRVSIPATVAGLPPALDKPGAEAVNAWVCQGVKCLPAISSLEELQRVSKCRELV